LGRPRRHRPGHRPARRPRRRRPPPRQPPRLLRPRRRPLPHHLGLVPRRLPLPRAPPPPVQRAPGLTMHGSSPPLTLALAAQVTASAPDPTDVMRLVEYVRWGGVFLSIFVIAGAYVLLRVVSRVAAELSTRFVHQRMLIQKVESV